MELRRATRQKAKIRLGLSAVSGGGKTYSAILIAKGLAGGDLSKVAIIDTENGSADLYAHMGEYNVLPLEAPYTPERYIAAIQACEKAGMDVIIIDSITHEWDGKGGILEISNSMSGNSYTNWTKLTPRHQAFIDAVLRSKCHMITTVRRKQDYELTTNDRGKLEPVKVGLKEVTREGFEYELTVNIELDIKHNATASKDRTGLFAGKPEFIPDEETGRMILEWCESGVDPIPAATPPAPVEKPELLPGTPDFDQAATYIKNFIESGKGMFFDAVDKLSLKRTISDETQALLSQAITNHEPATEY